MSDNYNVFSKDYSAEISPIENEIPIQAELVIKPELYGLSKPRRDVVIIRIAKDEE